MFPRSALCRTRVVRRHPRSGWLLVGLIVLISAVILALVGITFYLTEHLRTTSLRQNQTRAIYLAQAGVMYALYDFRRDAGVTLRSYDVDNPSVTPGPNDDAFILGGKTADYLLANMIPGVVDRANLSGRRDRLRLWRLYNVLAGTAVVITHITVSWDNPQGGEGVVRIEINGNRVWPWSGTLSAPQPSGTEIDIDPDVSIPSNTSRTNNIIWFSTDNVMQGKAFIDVAFRMSDHVVSGNPLDASVSTARYTPALATRSADIFPKSVGEVREGAFPFSVWRRLRTVYRVCAEVTNPADCNSEGEERTRTGALLSYEELSQRTP